MMKAFYVLIVTLAFLIAILTKSWESIFYTGVLFYLFYAINQKAIAEIYSCSFILIVFLGMSFLGNPNILTPVNIQITILALIAFLIKKIKLQNSQT